MGNGDMEWGMGIESREREWEQGMGDMEHGMRNVLVMIVIPILARHQHQ